MQTTRASEFFLVVKDGSVPRGIKTKLDIGVHVHGAIKQIDVQFDVPSVDGHTNLQANPVEQMFAEKLLSLLRHGVVANRPKDVFDLYYLSDKVSIRKMKVCMKEFIYANKRCPANDKTDVVRMLDIIFSARPFLHRLRNAKANWLQIDPKAAIAGIDRLIERM